MHVDLSLPTNVSISVPIPQGGLDAAARADVCRRVAGDIVRSRTLRHRLLTGIRLAEPNWDILLDLYLSERKGVRVSICDVAFIAGVSRSTGARCVANLIASGALEGVADEQDGRRTWISLSRNMKAALEVYFLQISGVDAVSADSSAKMKAIMFSQFENNCPY
ncbi:hypothetical protein S2M10_26060 [Sphingomonas sp. S2M10]|uniref:MarR family transcriptional regulator n=1 Tax=Sphingomonas sp. S2M10 TaxID=2705010 RepID=UPI001456E7EE|nr:helix-turn-helix domain-containing protein [Sphingomonas sp. S2M10]NLS27607.1 hypothetical protein [Sphingomonas sp. S2M10]